MKHSTYTFLLPLLVLLLVTSCSTSRNTGRDYPDDRYPYSQSEKDRDRRERDRDKRDRDRYLEDRDRDRDSERDRDRDRDEEWESRDRDRDNDRDRDYRREKGRSYPFSALDVPRGHLPPPGECKVWFPGRPPGQQPPPQSCASALRDVPLGAWVITHEGSRYRVSIFSRNKRNTIDEVRYYLTK